MDFGLYIYMYILYICYHIISPISIGLYSVDIRRISLWRKDNTFEFEERGMTSNR